MNVLFLDIDGVLNSRRSSLHLQTARDTFLTLKSTNPFDDMDPVAINMIRYLCERTGAQIVLSSAWRENWKKEDLSKRLGLDLFDYTDTKPGTRGEQIQRWLNSHPEVTEYAIVDDNSGMLLSQVDHFVQTDFDEGLTFANYRQLRDILNGKLGGTVKKALLWDLSDSEGEN